MNKTPLWMKVLTAFGGWLLSSAQMGAAYWSGIGGDWNRIEWDVVVMGATTAVTTGLAGLQALITNHERPEAPKPAPVEPVRPSTPIPVVDGPPPFVEAEVHTNRKWGARSTEVRKTLHPDLQKVCDRALELSKWDMALISGHRSEAEQRVLVAQGKSETMNSGHRRSPSIAVDVMAYGPNGGTWEAQYYRDIREAFSMASAELNVPMRDLIHLRVGPDLGHMELLRSAYPDVELA